MRRSTGVLCSGLVCLATASGAAPLQDGSHAVYLEDAAGTRIRIAEIDVTDGAYTVDMALDPFTDHFLSMRPFKCIEGPDKQWCHVPYPYDIARTVTGSTTDLEYDFLFLWKDSADYGIDMWNGVYYKLGSAEDGTLRGALHEMDMDILSAPPEPGHLRPIRETDLEPGDPDSHWLPVLIIEPTRP